MKFTYDSDANSIIYNERQIKLDTEEAFNIISKAWLRAGWDTKYVYSFQWFGRPIIQLPEDMIRAQEVIFATQPDYIVETGVAHGGSLIYYASLLKLMGKKKVVGVELALRDHNRKQINDHFLSPFIELVDGSSTEPKTLEAVKQKIDPKSKVLVFLDSNHSYEHVLNELRLYSSLINVGSYIVATDGIMKDLVGAPRSNADWSTNNPQDAARAFVKENKNYVIEERTPYFNEGVINTPVTYWPHAYIKRIS